MQVRTAYLITSRKNSLDSALIINYWLGVGDININTGKRYFNINICPWAVCALNHKKYPRAASKDRGQD